MLESMLFVLLLIPRYAKARKTHVLYLRLIVRQFNTTIPTSLHTFFFGRGQYLRLRGEQRCLTGSRMSPAVSGELVSKWVL
ncbi:hypothetical protein F5B22DRAFT_597704 [Xylaria bambusicola]|uniref:uncharacterized protein n=1 Tax=Xylaria bambusicola TaxID=326684 RepID=UPI002008A640|nr:uncharacterized protein F5B22DRAFT_597704 [Xylaria bambusicola]KAI0521116.1 hypothetical protein F5B22DRAFT_597704 [Xylaria bambusicola]